jgi:hypothetical protein
VARCKKVMSNGELYGLCIKCPGCDDLHVLHHDGKGKGWTWNGSLELPTFSPSLLVNYSGVDEDTPVRTTCHSFIKDGRIQYLGDCTHALKDQTVDLPEIE